MSFLVGANEDAPISGQARRDRSVRHEKDRGRERQIGPWIPAPEYYLSGLFLQQQLYIDQNNSPRGMGQKNLILPATRMLRIHTGNDLRPWGGRRATLRIPYQKYSARIDSANLDASCGQPTSRDVRVGKVI
jgi:hypothetical protein